MIQTIRTTNRRVMTMSNHTTYYIYCHIAPNGKRYFGQTCRKPEVRWNNGRGYRAQYFARAIEKYGWDNFEHLILCTVSSKEYADHLEQWFIKKYDTTNPANGYNMTAGGEGNVGWVPSEETRRKISERRTGQLLSDDTKKKISEVLREGYATGRLKPQSMSEETRKRFSRERSGKGNPMYGKHLSEEARARISEFHRGRIVSDETRAKLRASRMTDPNIKRVAVNQYNENGELIGQYQSIADASRATGIGAAQIRQCCNKLHWRAKGFIWRYQDQPETFPAQQMGLSF